MVDSSIESTGIALIGVKQLVQRPGRAKNWPGLHSVRRTGEKRRQISVIWRSEEAELKPTQIVVETSQSADRFALVGCSQGATKSLALKPKDDPELVAAFFDRCHGRIVSRASRRPKQHIRTATARFSPVSPRSVILSRNSQRRLSVVTWCGRSSTGGRT